MAFVLLCVYLSLFFLLSEYDTMQRLGITDGRQFLKRRLKEQGECLVFLQTCCVGKGIQDHIEAVIDETLTSGSWVHTRVNF